MLDMMVEVDEDPSPKTVTVQLGVTELLGLISQRGQSVYGFLTHFDECPQAAQTGNRLDCRECIQMGLECYAAYAECMDELKRVFPKTWEAFEQVRLADPNAGSTLERLAEIRRHLS